MIEINNVSKLFKDVHAVESVTLNIRPGERWGFLGHNGSGKTTLLKLMMGLIPVSNGTVKFRGELINPEIRKRIGYVSQGESLDTTLTVFENLFFFGLYHGLSFKEAKSRARNLLSSVEIKANPDQAVDNLSGGTRKKVLILRSFMLNPDYLFMDEPSNQLDFHSRIWFNDLSSRMVKDGKTLVLTSHDITDVENTCDHILVMFNGKVMASGVAKDLMESHFKGSVIEYTLDRPKPSAGDLQLVKNFEGQILGNRCFLFMDRETSPEKIIETINSPAITLRKPGLKDLYIKLTHMDIA